MLKNKHRAITVVQEPNDLHPPTYLLQTGILPTFLSPINQTRHKIPTIPFPIKIEITFISKGTHKESRVNFIITFGIGLTGTIINIRGAETFGC
jgi:hypothetical protein